MFVCESAWVLPWPGKCFAVAIVPFACSPAIAAATWSATRAGFSPKDRVPIIGLSGFELTSLTGARSAKTPTDDSSLENTEYIARVFDTSDAPSAILPGPVDDDGIITPQAPS